MKIIFDDDFFKSGDLAGMARSLGMTPEALKQKWLAAADAAEEDAKNDPDPMAVMYAFSKRMGFTNSSIRKVDGDPTLHVMDTCKES